MDVKIGDAVSFDIYPGSPFAATLQGEVADFPTSPDLKDTVKVMVTSAEDNDQFYHSLVGTHIRIPIRDIKEKP